MSLKEQILKSGMPLEMEIYLQLISLLRNEDKKKITINFVQADYPFFSIDEGGNPITRSLDFVVSIGQSSGTSGLQWLLYLLIECKSVSPDTQWFFMGDMFPKKDNIFGQCHTYLYQGKKPTDQQSNIETLRTISREIDKISAPTEQEKSDGVRKGPLPCVKGFVLGGKKDENKYDEKGKSIQTGLNQLRDALHGVAIDRFSKFTTPYGQVQFICFVPIIVTNASLRFLNPDKICPIEKISDDAKLDDISYETDKVLCRVPPNLGLVQTKLQNFIRKYENHNLAYFTDSVPILKDDISNSILDIVDKTPKQLIDFHITRFFERTPAYAYIANKNHLSEIIDRELKWINQLKPQANKD